MAAALSRKSTQKIADEYQPKIEKLWDAANRDCLKHLTLIMKNNPKKSIEAILKRPDVQEAMLAPYVKAAEKSEALLKEAWAKSEQDAVQKTKSEFALLKEQWKGHEVDTSLLDSLVADLHANAKAMRSRYESALKKDKSSIGSVAKGATLRARYSLTVAVWSVAQAVTDSACAAAGLNRMWLARDNGKHPDTCKWCRKLHGKVVGPGEPFPTDKSLKVYKNLPLMGPPRHPNCRCVCVATKLKKN